MSRLPGKSKLPVVVLLLATVLSGCARPVSDPPEVLFPAPGAVIRNPVALEADREVTWRDGETVLGVGRRWAGVLPAGTRDVTARVGGAEAGVRFTVEPEFGLGVIRRATLDGAGGLTLGPGEYVVVAGNPEASGQVGRESGWQDRLHGRVTRLVGQGARGARPPLQPLGTSAPPAEGSSRTLSMPSLTDTSSSRVAARLVLVTPRVMAYLDERDVAHADVVRRVSALVSAEVLPVVERAFGPWSDVNADGRVTLLFSSRVNDAGVAVGFFFAPDLLARGEGNPDTNEAEVLYLGVPDGRDANFTPESVTATACHEAQHLVNFARKTLPRLADPEPPVEALAVNEGLSHLAEDLCGYGVRGGNVAFVARYLAGTAGVSVDGVGADGRGDTAARRGAAYLLLRFMLDAQGHDEKTRLAWLRSVVGRPEVGLVGVTQGTGFDPAQWLWRWWWTLALAPDVPPGPGPGGYAPPEPVAGTTDWRGVNLHAGDVEVTPGLRVRLNGVTPVTAWPSVLPPRAFGIARMTGPTRLVLPDGAVVGVLRQR